MNPIKIISSYLNQDEIEITREEELRDVLRDLLKHGNSVVLLEFPDSGVLTIGVGTPFGFVEYMDEDRSPPYLVATDDPKNEEQDPFVEFDSGGTPTPIPIKNWLPFERVVEIVVYFLQNKKLPDYVSWIEV